MAEWSKWNAPECAKEVAKDTKHPGQEENLQKDSIAAEEEMRKLQEEIRQMEERHLLLSNKIHKNKMQDAEVVAELQRLQAGEERRGGNASQTGDCRLEALWQQVAAVCAVGPNQVDALANAVLQRCKESGAIQEQMPGRDERRRKG